MGSGYVGEVRPAFRFNDDMTDSSIFPTLHPYL